MKGLPSGEVVTGKPARCPAPLCSAVTRGTQSITDMQRTPDAFHRLSPFPSDMRTAAVRPGMQAVHGRQGGSGQIMEREVA